LSGGPKSAEPDQTYRGDREQPSEEEEEEEEGLFVFMDTVEGPRAPAAKLTARHSSLTRVRAAPLSPR